MQLKELKISCLRSVIQKICFVLMVCSYVNVAKAECWNEAASMYGHDPYILKAIGWKESRGHVGAVGSLLKDGNRAIGLMQINTIHLKTLRKYGIDRNDLFDPCTSQKVGAWVLADCLQKKGDIWSAVGCYYGGPASKAYTAMRGYANDVRRYYEAYKKNSGLPIQYTPMFANQNFTAPVIHSNNKNSMSQADLVNKQSTNQPSEKKVSGLQIIRF